MWSATHIKVTIQSAKGLLCKGKNNTNNCYVTIAMGKEKYQTSIKEKAESNVTWNEECELKIPDQGNRAELVLTCLHHNSLGIDEFLGQVTLPLNDMDPYDRPRTRSYKLESKPGKEKKNKERGELFAMISFTVKSGSLTDLSKKEKHKSSIGQLASSVGGSLLSIGQIEKRKGIKKIAKKFGSKLHLPTGSKKKNKDGDGEDGMSYTGSFASIGTPNRIRVVDSEDEDEFQFDKLSQKSSVSSLNLRDGGLQTPASNYAAKNPSPLMGSTGKGKDHHLRYDGSDNLSVDPELEEIENEFSIRARTLPPPSKPPRTPQMDISVNGSGGGSGAGDIRINGKHNNSELDEWESKLYGRSADSGNSDSLKRRSWEPVAVPLSSSTTVAEETVVMASANESMSKSFLPPLREAHTPETLSDSSSSSSDSEPEEEPPKLPEKPKTPEVPKKQPEEEVKPKKPTDLKFLTATNESMNEAILRKDSLTSPEEEKNEFAKFNASFAKFEQRHSSKVFDIEEETNNFLANESLASVKQRSSPPQPKPRPRSSASLEKEKEQLRAKEQEEEKIRLQKRAEEDAKLEAEIKANEKRLREEEEALQKEIEEREEEKRREAKRREEDLRILNFSKRLLTPEESNEKKHTVDAKPKEQKEEVKKKEKTEIKERPSFNLNSNNYNNNREKQSVSTASTPSPKTNERIIIGHEKSSTQAERRAEISAALAKKYEGKSREELMLIANGMENEALLQRQRVKELEDYLDNLLLRVMETQPKLLQNPYSRTTSAKSG
ncbi:rab11 interacting protein isoform X2 [Musca autumnalis]|uniref:rab11 interacting protein isoform X2 n=1 Tax=Musca autumnalis TaxID=221902 RepID=UPI003CEE6DB3